MDDQVDQRLKNNPKVRVQGDMYAYQVRLLHSSSNVAPIVASMETLTIMSWHAAAF